MDRQEQDKLEVQCDHWIKENNSMRENEHLLQTASVPNPYLLRLKCFLCQEPNPNINDENNNLRQPINSEFD